MRRLDSCFKAADNVQFEDRDERVAACEHGAAQASEPGAVSMSLPPMPRLLFARAACRLQALILRGRGGSACKRTNGDGCPAPTTFAGAASAGARG